MKTARFLNLKARDWVNPHSRQEILATFDDGGRRPDFLEGLMDQRGRKRCGYPRRICDKRTSLRSKKCQCPADNIMAGSQSRDSGARQSTPARPQRFTTSARMRMRNPRQYIRDLGAGNSASGLAADSRVQRAVDFALSILRALCADSGEPVQLSATQTPRSSYPFVSGRLEKALVETLNLQLGELVQIRTKKKIMATLDNASRNRGLRFDFEMLIWCGGD